jgi:hypothetical protein
MVFASHRAIASKHQLVVDQLIGQNGLDSLLRQPVEGNLLQQGGLGHPGAQRGVQAEAAAAAVDLHRASHRRVRSSPSLRRARLALAVTVSIGWDLSVAAVMPPSPLPSSQDLARYLEARGELGKPWMWHLLRLAKLKEAKDSIPPEEFVHRLQEAHTDLMRLGEFWKGREAEVFGGRYQPSQVIEPLPGSPDDR